MKYEELKNAYKIAKNDYDTLDMFCRSVMLLVRYLEKRNAELEKQVSFQARHIAGISREMGNFDLERDFVESIIKKQEGNDGNTTKC